MSRQQAFHRTKSTTTRSESSVTGSLSSLSETHILTGFRSMFLILFFQKKQKLLHDRPRIGSLVPEAAMIILVGMMAGYILHFVVHQTYGEDAADGNYEDVAESIFSFSPTIFFIILLPPIIFNSGYALQRDLFFRYITGICLYACLGTAICTLVVAVILYALSFAFVVSDYFAPTFLELLAFGALISATDPVYEQK